MTPIIISFRNLSDYLSDFLSDGEGVAIYSLGPSWKFAKPYTVDGVLFSILKRGYLDGTINGVQYHVQAPSVTFFPQGEVIEHTTYAQDKESVQIFMSREYAERIQLMDTFLENGHTFDVPTFPITYTQMDDLLNYGSRIKNVLLEDRPYKKRLLEAIMTTLAYDDIMLHLAERAETHSFNPTVETFLTEARTSASVIRDIHYYAKKCCKSTSQLERILRKETGKSILQWLDYFRAEVCKQELQYTNDSVSEIAHRLKYSSSEYFAHFFRQQTGMSPTEYRKRIRKQKSEE